LANIVCVAESLCGSARVINSRYRCRCSWQQEDVDVLDRTAGDGLPVGFDGAHITERRYVKRRARSKNLVTERADRLDGGVDRGGHFLVGSAIASDTNPHRRLRQLVAMKVVHPLFLAWLR
jgi:hypothetical protein